MSFWEPLRAVKSNVLASHAVGLWTPVSRIVASQVAKDECDKHERYEEEETFEFISHRISYAWMSGDGYHSHYGAWRLSLM